MVRGSPKFGFFRQALPIVWFGACILGFAWLTTYELTPGKATPACTKLASGANGYTLAVYIHPLCPCSGATLAELQKLLNDCDQVSARVYFVKHEALSYDLQKTRIWQSAAALPRTELIVDAKGESCRSMKVETSGQTILADKDGQVLFAGGITGARGHIGNNLGSQAVRNLVNGSSQSVRRTPVFGCAIFN